MPLFRFVLLSIFACVSLSFSTIAVAGGAICPVNNATLDGMPASIGGSATVNLQGTNVVEWEVIYNGVTTSGIPGTETSFVVTNVNGSQNTIQVRANGVGPDSLPCEDVVSLDIDYQLPVCDSVSQSPDSTVTPVDLRTVISLTAITSGATDAEIEGVAMTPVSGTPNLDDSITWAATTVAVQDRIIVADITNPDGEAAQCAWTIDINCDDPTFVEVASPDEIGITIAGTPGCTYSVRITTNDDGASTTYDVVIDSSGEGTLGVFVPFNALIEVGQQDLPLVTDSVTTGMRPPPLPAPVIVPSGGLISLTILFLLLSSMAWLTIRKNSAI